MTRSELIGILATRCRLPRATAELAVRAVFDTMAESLARGEGIEIRGLGSFRVREYPGYRGRNPRSGSTVDVAPKRLPHFKVGKPLRARIARRALARRG